MNADQLLGRSGSVMLSVLIITMVVSLGLGGVITIASHQSRNLQRVIESEEAFYLAEGAMEFAVNDYSVNFANKTLSGSSLFGVTRDQKYSANIVQNVSEGTADVYAEGEVNGVKRAVEVSGIRPTTMAKWTYHSDDDGAHFFVNIDQFFGPVFTGTAPLFWGGEFFEEVSTAATAGVGTEHATFRSGFFTSQTNKSSVGDVDDVDFVALKAASQTGTGQYFEGETTVLFDGDDMLIINEDRYGDTDEHRVPIENDQIVYVEKAQLTWWQQFLGLGSDGSLRTEGTVDGRVTLVSNGSVFIDDNLVYSQSPVDYPETDDSLGIISKNEVIISSEAPDDVQVHAVIIAAGSGSGGVFNWISDIIFGDGGGSFGVDSVFADRYHGEIVVIGGVIQKKSGATGLLELWTGNTYRICSGFNKLYVFDDRNAKIGPPHFPVLNGPMSYDTWTEVTPRESDS